MLNNFIGASTRCIHELKIWPHYFERVASGKKSFEVRKNDRKFNTGDLLNLREYNPETEMYTGRSCLVVVTFLLAGGQFGIEEDFVVMSVRIVDAQN
jgi:hypothetical protein